MNRSNGAARTFEHTKSTDEARCWPVRTSATDGSIEAALAAPSSEPMARSAFTPFRISWIRSKRSVTSMSPVGTRVCVGENALPPTDRSCRVLTGMETRSSSTG